MAEVQRSSAIISHLRDHVFYSMVTLIMKKSGLSFTFRRHLDEWVLIPADGVTVFAPD